MINTIAFNLPKTERPIEMFFEQGFKRKSKRIDFRNFWEYSLNSEI